MRLPEETNLHFLHDHLADIFHNKHHFYQLKPVYK